MKLFNDFSSIASEAKHKVKYGEGHTSDLATQLKILSPKQMLQRLSIALAQVKASNTSENLLNEIRQVIYPLCQEKEITEKVYIQQYNEFKKVIKQNGYYIYEF